MFKHLTIIFLLIFSYTVNAQEYIFKFKVNSPEEFRAMNRLVSIDHGYGVGEVVAYANAEQFAHFKTLGYEYQMMPHPAQGKALTMATTIAQMANWDRYPTHDVYIQMMNKFATDYPEICRVETIGTSEDGRAVKVLKISDNPDTNENEPEFFYTGQMHGDEIVAYIMFLKLADYLLENYDEDQRVTDLINNVEIWINPLSNPDGTYNGGDNTVSDATRSNANGVDLNRNFPTPNLTNPSGKNEAEVQMMIAFAENHNLVLSANSHSGIELVNYPWDTWLSSEKTHADNDWWYQVSWNYANSVHANAPGTYFQGEGGGVTHGGDWYVVDGSRQDHMGYYQNCREITLELSDAKFLDCNLLPAHWDYNKDAMIGYIEETFYGIRGIITDENENPLDAVISISGHDIDNSEVLSDSETGNYHRMIDDGSYNLTFTVSGYTPITINNINVTDNQTTIVDVMFNGSPSTTTLAGTVINHDTGNPIENAEIIITGQSDTYTVNTDGSGSYSVSDVTVGTYKFEMSAPGYMSAVHYETVSTADNDVSKYLIPSLFLTGTVIDAATGTAIEGAEIEVLNTSIAPVTSDIDGIYYISGIMEGTYDIKAYKAGYAPITVTEIISSDNNTIDFALLETEKITFEDEVPSEITFDDDMDWFRTNDQAYEGSYSMKSGAISDEQATTMILTTTTEAGTISFYKKVSSESTYDYLHFFIDGNEQDSWSGVDDDWSQHTYPITAGPHIFKWTYEKDGSEFGGEDCAWVDYIELPKAILTTYNVTFTVKNGANNTTIEGASVNLAGYGVQNTNSSGVAIFSDVYETEGTNTLGYTVSADGFSDETGDIQVLGDVSQIVNMQSNVSISIVEQNISIYPNPSKDYFTIESNNTINQIKITDISGRTISEYQPNTKKFTISDLSSGMYFITIQTNTDIITKKVIVN